MTTLFEVSWEVCNKVGGIHTVIRSKIPFMKDRHERYVLIGPLLGESAEFEERAPDKHLSGVLERMKERGIRCRHGVWLAPSEPAVILIDPKSLLEKKDELKRQYWERFGIDSLNAGFEFDEPMCFSTAAGILIEEYLNTHPKRIVLQAHEWMAGFSILHLADEKIGTVFTTHATMLGRSIMGNGYLLYEMLDDMDPDQWASRLNVRAKHLAEKACANTADVFTTVSEITGREAEKILGRKPDVILFNGFHAEKFPTFEETSIMHDRSRDKLRELVTYTFFPHYTFDLENTLFFFTSGRYEFGNKGLDVLIDALGILNHLLKEERSDKTIVVLFWVIMGRRNVRLDLLENKNFYHHVKGYVDWQSKPLLRRIVLDILSGKHPGEDHTFAIDFIRTLHSDVSPLKRSGEPPLLTHDIDNPEHDPVLRSCRDKGLLNRADDRVKILLYPGYLDGSDGLLNMQYYDATVGAHLGVFPSHYEPWGYTPLESAVLGVPSLTTDLAGFGRYVKECCEAGSQGVFVVDREKKSREDVIMDLSERMHSFSKLDHGERVKHAFAAKNIAGRCDWKIFIKHYFAAHEMALERGA